MLPVASSGSGADKCSVHQSVPQSFCIRQQQHTLALPVAQEQATLQGSWCAAQQSDTPQWYYVLQLTSKVEPT
jgi:hypothetical protein